MSYEVIRYSTSLAIHKRPNLFEGKWHINTLNRHIQHRTNRVVLTSTNASYKKKWFEQYQFLYRNIVSSKITHAIWWPRISWIFNSRTSSMWLAFCSHQDSIRVSLQYFVHCTTVVVLWLAKKNLQRNDSQHINCNIQFYPSPLYCDEKNFSEMDPVDCGCWVDALYRVNTIQATREDHILASHSIFITCHPIIRRLRALYFSRYIGYPSIAKWMDGNIMRGFSILNLIFCWLKPFGNDKGKHHWCLYSHHMCTECMWYRGTLQLIFQHATCIS